jgi:hypothetical protein
MQQNAGFIAGSVAGKKICLNLLYPLRWSEIPLFVSSFIFPATDLLRENRKEKVRWCVIHATSRASSSGGVGGFELPACACCVR